MSGAAGGGQPARLRRAAWPLACENRRRRLARASRRQPQTALCRESFNYYIVGWLITQY